METRLTKTIGDGEEEGGVVELPIRLAILLRLYITQAKQSVHAFVL